MKMLEHLAWIDRLPRPERNGVKGVLLMVAFLVFCLTPILINGNLIDMVLCEVAPWRCLNQSREVVEAHPAPEPLRLRYHDLGKLVAPPKPQIAKLERTPLSEHRDHPQAGKVQRAKATWQIAGTTGWTTTVPSSSGIISFCSGSSTCVMSMGTSAVTSTSTAQFTTMTSGTSGTAMTNGSLITVNGSAAITTFTSGMGTASLKSERKPPFCRVTCSFHHRDNQASGTQDVEVEDVNLCRTGKIESNISVVMGWKEVSVELEALMPWPGPAGGGLDSYKLYWSQRTVPANSFMRQP